MRAGIAAAVAVLALADAGCPRRYPAGDGGHYDSAEELLQAAHRRRQEIRSLRAAAVVTIQRGGRRSKLRAALAVQRPASLRLECESFFGQPVSVLVSNGFSYRLWQAENGAVTEGRATAQEMMQVLSLPLDGAELAGTMLGEPPLIAWAASKLKRDGRRRHWRIELSNSRQRQQLLLEAERLLPLEVSTWEEGRLLYRVMVEPEKNQAAAALVREIYFQMPAEDILVHIRLRELEINPLLEEGIFSLATAGPPS